jgi:hypothetical protein
MAEHLFIVPGYSDEDFSFLPLRNLLVKEHLYTEKNIQSIEYASLDDDVDYYDLGRKLDDVYNEFLRTHPDTRIDVLAHSTGSLVVRYWLHMRRRHQVRHSPTKLDTPVDHLYLFAPANFGSDLARIGRSALNAVAVTFLQKTFRTEVELEGNRDGFETGKRILAGLEPGSPLQWELSINDLHSQTYFGENDPTELSTYPFVFAAGQAEKSLRSLILSELQKDGTDSTVRVAGTSLNTRLFTLTDKYIAYSRGLNPVQPDSEYVGDTSDRRRKFENIPFAVFAEYDHCGIINDNARQKKRDNQPIPDTLPSTWKPLGLLKKAKAVTNAQQYAQLAREFETDLTYKYREDRVKDPSLGLFQQFFFKVTDDIDQPVKDFFIQFFVTNVSNNATVDEGSEVLLPSGHPSFLNKWFAIGNGPFSENGASLIDTSIDSGLTDKFRELFNFRTSFQFHSLDNSHGVLELDITNVQKFLSDELKPSNQLVLRVSAKPAYNGSEYSKSEFVIYDRRSKESPHFLDFFSPLTTTLVKVVLYRAIQNRVLRDGDFTDGSKNTSEK